MNITTLQERITKANEKIAKKQNTIAKYYKTIEKKQNMLAKKYNWNPEDREQHIATLQSRGFTETDEGVRQKIKKDGVGGKNA